MTSESLIQKLWSYCNILRDDGLSSSDYVEQLTYLLFLKMAEEHSKPPFLHLAPLTDGYNWSSLVAINDEDQVDRYERILRRLSQRTDLFGTIYKNALNKFRDPAKLKLVITEINAIEWSKFDSDVKGEAYEGLLERTAADGKAGAGQYFTPRALVDAISSVIMPAVDETICDPACGTGGFLLAAYRHIVLSHPSKHQLQYLLEEALHGVELVESVARLCLMNLVLHGIGGRESPILVADSLLGRPKKHFDVVLANPPFGKWSSITTLNDVGDEQKESHVASRDDFWVATNNKQLNFLQHIFTILNMKGRAAVVIPDNVLFEGGAGETVRRQLLEKADVHTLLRLPTGIFYAHGVRANVLFFDRKPVNGKSGTKCLWIYDMRTNVHFTLRQNSLKRSDLDDFVANYCPKDRSQRIETERFKKYAIEDLSQRDRMNLDIFWLKDESMEETLNLENPHMIAAEIADDLESAMNQFSAIVSDLNGL